LSLQADFAEAWQYRGQVLEALGRTEEALVSCDKALALKPDLAEAWADRAGMLQRATRFAEAIECSDRALALDANSVAAHYSRGVALVGLARPAEALAGFDRAVTIDPQFVAGHAARGAALFALGAYDEAKGAYDRALAIDPGFAEAWCGVGNVHFVKHRLLESIAAFDKALAIRPDYVEAISNKAFALDFADVGFEEQQAARKHWWRAVGEKIAAAARPPHDNDRDPVRRLRLGYVSGDFWDHSAALCFGPVLRNHDRAQFEVFCYACSAKSDDKTAEFKRLADRWCDATALSDDALAERIRADGIDILVDLSGHSGGNRLGVFARKPAPIQVTAWGHATGTGLATIDYLFSDPVAIPPDVREVFAETIYDLPCLTSIDPLPAGLAPAEPPVLANGYITFGAFNRAYKMSDEAVQLWGRILQAVPGSRILLKHTGFDDPAMRARLAQKFLAQGVATDRIEFMGGSSRKDHLLAFSKVDMGLDTFPQNGGVSTWESLQMGVPVVTRLGNSMPSRLGAAIVSSIGLTDWVAADAEGYLAIAVKFAAEPDRLRLLRHELPARIMASEAGNSALYTHAVERAYRTMWERYCESSLPK
jgi:predicted O-linked N-acetylglucosamine transferase (SPINDLY family)